jgi:phospholipid/cholesterol/gamma-HCH transport system substrate-binding protein
MVETVLGAAVLIIAAVFVFYFSRSVDAGAGGDGYRLTAAFAKIDGIDAGAPVRISGINVGKVTALTLNPETYQAEVTMLINRDVKLPRDTAAVVTSAGLLDGKFMTLEPGGDEEFLADGEAIEYTQSTLSLEQLLGQVVFSLTKDDKKDGNAAPAPSNGRGVPAAPTPPASVDIP